MGTDLHKYSVQEAVNLIAGYSSPNLHTYNVQEALNLIAQSGSVPFTPQINLTATTTNATQTELLDADGNRITLDANSSYFFKARIIALRTDTGNYTEGYEIVGVIKKGANAASVAMVDSPIVVSSFPPTNLYSPDALPDTTNGSLNIYFTGASGQTIKVKALVELFEVSK